MAEHNIDVKVESDVKADEASKQMRILAGVLKTISPEMRKATTVFNALTRTAGVFNGSLGAIAGAAGGISLAKMALKSFAEAVDQAKKTLEDFAKTGEDITNEGRGKSTKELPQLYRERETLKKQLRTQNEIVMQAGNELPDTQVSAWIDRLKGSTFASFFGIESAQQNYEDVKAQRDYTKRQLAGVNRLISTLETQKRKEDKQLPQFTPKIVNYMDKMSKMGLYMTGGFATGQGNIEVQLLKEQKDILKKIEKNTKNTQNTAATYS